MPAFVAESELVFFIFVLWRFLRFQFDSQPSDLAALFPVIAFLHALCALHSCRQAWPTQHFKLVGEKWWKPSEITEELLKQYPGIRALPERARDVLVASGVKFPEPQAIVATQQPPHETGKLFVWMNTDYGERMPVCCFHIQSIKI